MRRGPYPPGVDYVGRIALLLGLGIAGLQVLRNGEESLPLLVLALLACGLALTLAPDRRRDG